MAELWSDDYFLRNYINPRTDHDDSRLEHHPSLDVIAEEIKDHRRQCKEGFFISEISYEVLGTRLTCSLCGKSWFIRELDLHRYDTQHVIGFSGLIAGLNMEAQRAFNDFEQEKQKLESITKKRGQEEKEDKEEKEEKRIADEKFDDPMAGLDL
jgi:hypothetical protein